MSKKFIFVVIFSIVALGCGELRLDLTTAIEVQEKINSENIDADEAATCIVEFDSSTTEVDDEYIDTLQIEVSKECLKDIIENKIEDDENQEEIL